MINIVIVGHFRDCEQGDGEIVYRLMDIISRLGKGYEKEAVVTVLTKVRCLSLNPAHPCKLLSYIIIRDTVRERAEEIARAIGGNVEIEIIDNFISSSNQKKEEVPSPAHT